MAGEPVEPVLTVDDNGVGPAAPGAPGAPAVPDGGGAPAGPALPGPAVLSVGGDLYPEPGQTEIVFWIANTGGSPLTWNIPAQEGHQTASPENGVVAPGESAMVAFEMQSSPPGGIDVDYPLMVQSNGGSKQVTVHMTSIEPVFEIVAGTWNIRNGNTFLPAYGVMDLGLKLKNIGTEPLTVEPVQSGGMHIIGGPWVLAPGEQVHLQVVLCNATYSGGIPDFHDRDLHISTSGWQGTIDYGVRFTLAPGQSALPC